MGALALIALLATTMAPAAPRRAVATGPVPAVQHWETGEAGAISALARDIADTQEAIEAARPGSHTPGEAAASARRLRSAVSRLRSRPGPPDPALARIWASALQEASAAADLLTGAAPSPSVEKEAASQLQASGEAVVAVVQAARRSGRLDPH